MTSLSIVVTEKDGIAAWAAALSDSGNVTRYGQALPAKTQPFAILTGVVDMLKRCSNSAPLSIRSNFAYLTDGMNHYIASWQEQGWKRADGKIVAHADLWEVVQQHVTARSASTEWVIVRSTTDTEIDALRVEARNLCTAAR